MFQKVVFLASVAAFIPALIAVADDQPSSAGPDPKALFAQLDANKDGQIESDEIPPGRKSLFERLLRTSDKNGDGKLSADEFAAGLRRRPDPAGAVPLPFGNPEERPQPEMLLKRLDKNHDGKLSLDEVPEPRRSRFEMLIARGDKDGDKALSLEELRAVLKPGSPGKPREPAKSDSGAASNGSSKGRLELFEVLDADRDGTLSSEEIAAAAEVLRRLDANRDGRITLDEIHSGAERGVAK